MRRKPLNPDSAQAEGVDYLLREFKALRTAVGTGAGSGAATTGNRIDPTLFIAAYNALPHEIAQADYVCDGTADQEEINAALLVLSDHPSGNGGVIQLSGGEFLCSDMIHAANDFVWIRGMGMDVTQVVADIAAPYNQTALILNNSSRPIISDMGVYVNADNYDSAVRVQSDGAYIFRVWAYVDPAVINSGFAAVVHLDCNEAYLSDSVVAGGIDNVGGAGVYLGGQRGSIENTQIDGGSGGCEYGIRNVHANYWQHRIVNNHISGHAVGSIYIDDDDCIVIGNNIAGGLVIGANADGTRVGGNIGTVTDGGTNTVFMDNTGVLASVVKHDNFTQTGALTIGSGTVRYYTQTDRTITGVYAMVSGAPVTSPAIFDVNMDGATTIFTTQANRPEIAAAAFLSAVEVPDVTAWDAGSYLLIDVDAANSATDLILVVQYTEA